MHLFLTLNECSVWFIQCVVQIEWGVKQEAQMKHAASKLSKKFNMVARWVRGAGNHEGSVGVVQKLKQCYGL